MLEEWADSHHQSPELTDLPCPASLKGEIEHFPFWSWRHFLPLSLSTRLKQSRGGAASHKEILVRQQFFGNQAARSSMSVKWASPVPPDEVPEAPSVAWPP